MSRWSYHQRHAFKEVEHTSYQEDKRITLCMAKLHRDPRGSIVPQGFMNLRYNFQELGRLKDRTMRSKT